MERKLRVHYRMLAAALAVAAAPAGLAAQGRPSPLPAIPPAAGSLAVTVVYPSDGQLIQARDSTFFFGNTGNGAATLTVNGQAVEVAPNGAFLAWLPLPPDSAPFMRFVARLGADSALRTLRLRLVPAFVPPDSAAWIDRDALSPRGVQLLEPGEAVRVSVHASPAATVSLRLPSGRVIPLAPDTGIALGYGPFDREARAARRETRYAGVFAAEAVGPGLANPLEPDPARVPLDSARAAWVTVETPTGSARAPLPLRLGLLEPLRRPVVVLDDDTARAGATDGAVAGAPLPNGTYHWFFRNGTVAGVSGRVGNQVRLQLSRAAVAWVDLTSVAAVLPEGTPPPRTTLALVRLFPSDQVVAARFAMSQRVPVRVDADERSITVRLYSTTMDLDWVQYGGTDPLVPRVTWAQPTSDEGTVTFELSRPVFGWRARWDGTDLILEIRRPPVIDRLRPLRGRTIAIDAGHPPGGATGPTGFRESDANLGVAQQLRRLLEAAGARVIMTRTDATAVELYPRVNLAEQANADVLVSIHNNAFPDGVNPWVNNGTSTYYFHPGSARLAMLVQRAMVAQMGLRDLGAGRGDLALVRNPWMPSVLTEGAFLMIPAQENALRGEPFQRRYATGVMRGIEQFLRELAGR